MAAGHESEDLGRSKFRWLSSILSRLLDNIRVGQLAANASARICVRLDDWRNVIQNGNRKIVLLKRGANGMEIENQKRA